MRNARILGFMVIVAAGAVGSGAARGERPARRGPYAKCGKSSDAAALARILSLRGDAAAATELYERACLQKDGPGCYALGTQYNIGQGGVAKDASRAAQLFLKAAPLVEAGCKAGCQRDCVTLGWMLHTAQGVPHDGPRSLALLTAACELGAAEGCFLLGTLHAFAYETAKDPARAAAAHRRSCDLGDPLGCNSVAYHYEKGDGLPLDPAQARRFYARSCDLGMAASCNPR